MACAWSHAAPGTAADAHLDAVVRQQATAQRRSAPPRHDRSNGQTLGALYHHFDGKKGLLEAVIVQIDAEM